jgi:two-component system, chemotaxis family, protein-glutamate methylesterase/glutaminase
MASLAHAGVAQDAGPVRVMIVDDSAVVRSVFRRLLDQAPDIVVAAVAVDGQMAIDTLRRHPVDIVLLDIEMPVLDGLSALPQLLAVRPAPKVIMTSSLTRRGAAVTVEALALGASDYIAKPTSGEALRDGGFAGELLGKIRALGGARRRKAAVAAARPAPRAPIVLRPPLSQPPHAIAIGSSTGGPQALLALCRALGGAPPVPVFVTQHMPATFTAILAEQIAKATGLPCREAAEGEPARPGHIHVAQGGFHLEAVRGPGGIRLRLSDAPPESFCRPAVDPMLRSLVRAYDGRVLAVILTGMGRDGLVGARALVEAGGAVIAQDEATSVVWGMPGVVATAGLASAVLPLGEIGPYVRRVLGEGGR